MRDVIQHPQYWYWYRNDSVTTHDVDLWRREAKNEGRFEEVSDKTQIDDRCARGLKKSVELQSLHFML